MTAVPRLLFVTGPGGDGTTTVAAATATAAARGGATTLLLSGEPPARLAAVLGTAPPAWPDTAATPAGFQAARADAGRWFREAVLSLREVLQRHARPALDLMGARARHDDDLSELADLAHLSELADLPGAPALALLAAVRSAAATALRCDLLVVDLPEATEAIRLLALPAQLRRLLSRVLPRERRVARALHPVLAQLAGVPPPTGGLFAAADGWDGALAAVQELTEGPRAAVRLVLDPGGRSVAALRTARAGLALHGLALEGVVANRLVPAGSADPWLAAFAARQREALRELARTPGLAAAHPLPHLGRDAGPGDLAALSAPPPAPGARRETPTLVNRLAGQGLLVWHLPLPGAAKADLGLVRTGDDLIVDVGPFRRALPLPPVLRRCTVTGAALADDGRLAVRFAPDPAQWPRTQAWALNRKAPSGSVGQATTNAVPRSP